MAQSKQALKARIRSIKTTSKITGAMELIANAKLVKEKNKMEQNREYASVLKDTLYSIMASINDIENDYLSANNSHRTAYIIFTSDLGLCGSYNANVLKALKDEIKDDDEVIVVGSKSYQILSRLYDIKNELLESDNLSYESINKVVDYGINAFKTKSIGKLKIIYTSFINTVSYEVRTEELLPFKKEEGHYQEVIFDPSPKEVLNDLIEMTLKSLVFAYGLESKVSEQASRRMAMETANDNAADLLDELTLSYNQARQAAITQEITEIVSGADAL